MWSYSTSVVSFFLALLLYTLYWFLHCGEQNSIFGRVAIKAFPQCLHTFMLEFSSVSIKEKELAELEQESVDIRLLLAGLREYSSMETLTPEVVNKIIKRIEVHNSEMVNGHKRVGIDIYFTGVGLVDLATIKEMLAIAESSRP